jgi:hypothetical protein
MLNPADFASLGTLQASSGDIIVSTSPGFELLTAPNGQLFYGVNFDGIAVFTFSSIDISSATFTVDPNGPQGGNLPFALLSQGNLTLNGLSINLSASGATAGSGGNLTTQGQGQDSTQAGAGGGAFGGAGGQGGTTYGNGPFGPVMFPGAAGGATYGGVFGPIQGGSAGGSSIFGTGGGGGGAIELGATGNLTLSNTQISANGGNGNGNSTGGGSGGSISLLGASVNIGASSLLSATGGSGGPQAFFGGLFGGGEIGGGGGGGGGRINIETAELSLLGSSDLLGGSPGGFGDGSTAGANGIIETYFIPEPPSLLMAVIGTTIGAGYAIRRGRRWLLRDSDASGR